MLNCTHILFLKSFKAFGVLLHGVQDDRIVVKSVACRLENDHSQVDSVDNLT